MKRGSPAARVSELMRRHGAQSVLRSARIAKRVGLAPSDLECLDLLFLDGPLTPGAIMAGTGLSSAAVTAMIDRMERRGFIRRERDPSDGRRVQVSIDKATIAPIVVEYRDSERRWRRLNAQFSGDELLTVARYLEATVAVLVSLNRDVKE